MLLAVLLPVNIYAAEGVSGEKELDIPEIVMEHLADSYEWHIATYEGRHLSIPLPVILRSEATGSGMYALPTAFRKDFSLTRPITERFMRGLPTVRRCVR